METLIKESGIAEIKNHSKEAIDKQVEELALEANRQLMNAAYSESLIPTVDNEIATYKAEIEKINADIATIDSSLEALTGKEKHTRKQQRKQLETMIRTYENAIKKLEDRKAKAYEKINTHRFDAQAAMHRIAFFKETSPESLSVQLITHIEGLNTKVEKKEEETKQA